jgi:hypothetical protein
VSQGRKSLHKNGLVLTVIGIAGFFVCFIGFALAGFAEVEGGGGPHPIFFWIGGVVCMAMIGIGQVMRRVARRGMAGSGLVLDPERARDDLEPWARMGGGLVGDALDESGLMDDEDDDGDLDFEEPAVVKVRCQECRALNDEDAKFCKKCGKTL